MSRSHHIRRLARLALAGLLPLAAARAETRTWIGPANGDWFTAANWSSSQAPTNAGDSALITNGTVLLASNTAALADFTLTNATLVFSNWNTRLTASNAAIWNRGTVTVANAFATNQMSNNVYVVCTNFTLNTGGVINVDGKGYKAENGPGTGTGASDLGGGGYGGRGGDGDSAGIYDKGGPAYGTTNAPTDPGSGASGSDARAGAGGGAVRIEASGNVTVNGTITANGAVGQYASGSGGGIYIVCGGAFSGGTSGVIRANSVNAGNGAGGGGRIAVVCANLVPANVKVCFAAKPGATTGSGRAAGMGTLYLSNTNLLSETLSQFDNVRLIIPGFASWSVANLTVSNSVLSLGEGEGGFTSLAVANDLVITNGGLSLGGLAITNGLSECGAGSATNPTVTVGGNVMLTGGGGLALGVNGESSNIALTVGTNLLVNGGRLVVGGTNQIPQSLARVGNTLTLTNGGSLMIYAGVTNAAATNCGALLAVTGAVALGPGAWIYPYSHPTNGGPVWCRMQSLKIATNAGINANSKGYVGVLNAAGLGPGKTVASGNTSGAGHGGKGGKGVDGQAGGTLYDSTNAPLAAGSSAGGTSQAAGGTGGGAIRLDVADAFVFDGAITVNGGNGDGNNFRSGGGSGGSIFINCQEFSGTATAAVLQAAGGNGAKGNTGSYQSGGGGGGRISVAIGLSPAAIENLVQGLEVPGLNAYSNHAAYLGSVSVTNGVGYTDGPPNGAESGTWQFLTTNLWLTILGLPGNYGSPQPDGYGSTVYLRGAVVTNSVATPADRTNGIGHACIGWTLADDQDTPIDSGAGTQAVCTLSTNLLLTWHWTNEYQLTVAAVTNGSVNSNAINGWYTNGTAVAGIEAIPAEGFGFLRWVGPDVPAGSEMNNPLTVTMTQPRTLTAAFYSLAGETKRWNGTGDWYTGLTNWTPTANPPGTADVAIIESGTVRLPFSSTVVSLTVSNNAALVFSNWDTLLTAGDLFIRPGATVTVANAFTTNQMSNRVWIACGNLTMDAGGRIDVTGKGYIGIVNGQGQGPGGGRSVTDGPGAGYGGRGGIGNTFVQGGVAYGDTNAPTDPGSSGAGGSPLPGGNGGGAVRLDIAGAFVLNGAIAANGLTSECGGSYRAAGGSGGAIYINCKTFSSSSCVLETYGGNGAKGNTGSYQSGGGGGGRIAVWIDVPPNIRNRYIESQGNDGRAVVRATSDPQFGGAFSIANGLGYKTYPDPNAAQPGTCFFFRYLRGARLGIR